LRFASYLINEYVMLLALGGMYAPACVELRPLNVEVTWRPYSRSSRVPQVCDRLQEQTPVFRLLYTALFINRVKKNVCAVVVMFFRKRQK